MKITYFKDTDTLLVNFKDDAITETKDFGEDILVELDNKGSLVSMTVEHASKHANMPDFAFNQVSKSFIPANL
ncbi:MAG: DUF2283 domain-containing protein [Cyclobacteriaceae bacterium]|nr:DUF2283 domain-containing protein [Cyclobacteriaceae bacterium]